MGREIILSSPPLRIAASVAVKALITGNSDRRNLILFNDSVGYLYVKYGPEASLTDFTFRLAPGETREVLSPYTGAISGIWSAAAAGEACQVTELVGA